MSSRNNLYNFPIQMNNYQSNTLTSILGDLKWVSFRRLNIKLIHFTFFLSPNVRFHQLTPVLLMDCKLIKVP